VQHRFASNLPEEIGELPHSRSEIPNSALHRTTNTYHCSFVLRGGLSGLGGVVIGFGNGFAGGRPRGGSGVMGLFDGRGADSSVPR
jgi:hypothetical protein